MFIRRALRMLSMVLLLGACRGADLGADPGSASHIELGPLIAPRELAERLDDVEAGRMVVFYVGPPRHFEQGHVPGARRLPLVATPEGNAALRRELEKLPLDVEIIVYCGCCPYERCPSVRPANEILRASGRSGARWLDLPTSFEADWTDKGLPVAAST